MNFHYFSNAVIFVAVTVLAWGLVDLQERHQVLNGHHNETRRYCVELWDQEVDLRSSGTLEVIDNFLNRLDEDLQSMSGEERIQQYKKLAEKAKDEHVRRLFELLQRGSTLLTEASNRSN